MSVDVTSSSRDKDLTHLENQATSVAPSPDPDLAEQQTILRIFLDQTEIDSDDDFSDRGFCANCNRPSLKGEQLKRCVRCYIIRYCRKTGVFTK